jgi:hypothetical protein
MFLQVPKCPLYVNKTLQLVGVFRSGRRNQIEDLPFLSSLYILLCRGVSQKEHRTHCHQC